MDAISVRCRMCEHPMKFSAEKAGKRAKCPKCDTIVQIPTAEEQAIKEQPAAAPAPAAQSAFGDEDDGPASYEVFLDPELEERRRALQAEEDAKAKQKGRKKLPKVGRKIKAISDAESWQKVRIGLLFVQIGAWIWLFTHLLQGTYVLLGSNEFSEYAPLLASNLEVRGGPDLPERGEFWDIDLLGVYLGMIAGRDFLGYASACITIATIFYFIQALLWGVGYAISLPVPRRFGTLGELITTMILWFVNLISMFVFKFLPVVGAITYVMIPLVTPEIIMTEYNMERTIPIHLMWTANPFWETFASLILLFLFYLQPAFHCIFIWSIGTMVRDENLESSARGVTQMGLGTFFALMCFHLLSICGASPVLVMVLRVIYAAWFIFLLMFIVQYAGLIGRCRAVLYEKINPANELDE